MELHSKIFGKEWTPEAVLLYKMLRHFAEVKPTAGSCSVQNMQARVVVLNVQGPPADGSLIIEALDQTRIRITAWEPSPIPKKSSPYLTQRIPLKHEEDEPGGI